MSDKAKKASIPNRKPAAKRQKVKVDGTPSRQGEGGGPPLGSMNHEKFKDDAARQKLFKALIKHLEGGWDQDTFPLCAWNTVTRYVLEYPEIFIDDEIQAALRRGKFLWERRMVAHSLGQMKGSSDSGMIFTVKNKLKWSDRIQHVGSGTEPLVFANMDAAEAMTAYKNMIQRGH